jgi:hypothetical protein
MTCSAAKLKDLRAPFPAAQIGWRVGARSKEKDKGQALPYIDARDVQTRLDEVVGPENWQVSFSAAPHGTGVLCSISIHVEERWVVKQDGGQQDKAPEKAESNLDPVKGVLSDSFKRAGAMWGIGRYLYSYDTPWVTLKNEGKHLAAIPVLPDEFLPEAERGKKATSAVTANAAAAAESVATGTTQSTPTVASAKPMYDSSVAGDAVDPTAEAGSKELFQSSVAGDMDDPSVESAPAVAANRRIDLPIIGTADQWSALPQNHKETVRLLTERIEKRVALPGVRSFLTEGKGSTTLPEWVRKSLLTNVAAVSGDIH